MVNVGHNLTPKFHWREVSEKTSGDWRWQWWSHIQSQRFRYPRYRNCGVLRCAHLFFSLFIVPNRNCFLVSLFDTTIYACFKLLLHTYLGIISLLFRNLIVINNKFAFSLKFSRNDQRWLSFTIPWGARVWRRPVCQVGLRKFRAHQVTSGMAGGFHQAEAWLCLLPTPN